MRQIFGPVVLFPLFFYYKPVTTTTAWAEHQAEERIRKRGINLDDFVRGKAVDMRLPFIVQTAGSAALVCVIVI